MALVRSGVIAVLALATVGLPLSASGPVGFYGIVERVVFEPDSTAPQRIQVWGVFAYANGCSPRAVASGAPAECSVASASAAAQSAGVSSVERGYLYFTMPTVTPGLTTEADVNLVKREWADLHAVAGTGQAIGFGRWGYIGPFGQMSPDRKAQTYENVIRPTGHRGGDITDLRVRPAAEVPGSPATYQTNAGIVRLSDRGSHADIVRLLRNQLP